MASLSRTSSGSPPPPQNQRNSSGSDEDLQQVMDQRKRKRMASNRESARRSRMRKQKHLDDLMAQVAQLSKENNQISTRINFTKQHFVNVEAENSVLRAQMMELTQRLQSLNEILNYINTSSAAAAAAPAAAGGVAAAGSCVFETEEFMHHEFADGFLNVIPYQQPIMASAEMFDYY